MKRNWIIWIVAVLILALIFPMTAIAETDTDSEAEETVETEDAAEPEAAEPGFEPEEIPESEEKEFYPDGYCGENLTWSYDSVTATLTIEGTGEMDDYQLPDTGHGTYHVPPWYDDMKNIKKVVFGEGITYIGEEAFCGCTALTSVSIPNSVRSMGPSVFYRCTALKSVSLGSGLTAISQQAFMNCSALQSITIPGSVKNVDYAAFYQCTALTSAAFENGATWVGKEMFRDCTKLASITLPDSITFVGTDAFYNTAWMNSQPRGLIYLNRCLIGYNETYPTNLTIQNGTKVIGAFALHGADITSVTIPNSVVCISNNAFSHCKKLTSVTVPDSVTYIGDGAFSSCHTLTSVKLPNTVEYLGNGLFNSCYALKTATLPDGIESIGTYMFLNCSSLESIVIPDSVTSIGMEAFSNCTNLQTLVLGNSVTSIREDSFKKTTGITSLTLPCNLNPIDKIWTVSLTSLRFTPGTGIMNAYTSYNVTRTPWYLSRENELTVTIDEGVRRIGDYVFYNCTGLKEINIPESVEEIGQYAFSGCTGLTDVVLPEGVKTVDYKAFERCTNLKSFQIPNSLETISGNMLTGSTALETVTLSTGTTCVGSAAFSGCSRLSDVFYKGTEEQRAAALPETAIGANNESFVSAAWHYYPDSIEVDAESITFGSEVLWKGSTPYMIYNGNALKPSFSIKNKNGNVIDPFCYDVTYSSNVKPGTATATISLLDGKGGTFTKWFKIFLPGTTQTSVANSENGITISWQPVKDAKGYVIYRRAWNLTSSGWTEFKRWNNTTATTWTDTTVYAGTRYQYGIKAYFSDPMDNYNLGEVGPLKTTVRITTRKLLSLTASRNNLTVKWAGSKYFTGYQIKYSTDPSFIKDVTAIKITDPAANQYVVKDLTYGKTYYVTIRSYHVFEGMTYFGEWSNVLSCKIN